MLYYFKKKMIMQIILQKRFVLFRESGQLRSSTIGLRDGNFNLKDEKLQWPSSNDEYGLYQGYAENPRYADEQEIIDATNISRKTVNNHLTKMGYINRWSLGSTAIDKTDFMNRVFIYDFLFQRHERDFFKKTCYWRWNLDFLSKYASKMYLI